MKIIDQTPFVNEEGGVSLMDQLKAMLKFGPSWLPEIQAQKVVMDYLKRGLERGYTLLRNFTLPGTQALIPMILVGPPGVFVLYVTHLTGMYRARGNQWGVIEHNTFKPAPVNLLTRTERMGRAVQLFLQRQSFEIPNPVEGILLGANPSLHVDSVRPIIRVVLSDALERFVISIAQARAVMSSELVQETVNRLQHPRTTQLVPTPAPIPEPEVPISGIVPPVVTGTFQELPQSGSEPDPGFGFLNIPAPETESILFPESTPVSEVDFAGDLPPMQMQPGPRSGRKRFSGKQWIFLIAFGMIEIIILIVFAILILNNL